MNISFGPCCSHIGLDVCYFAGGIQRGFQPNQITCLEESTNPQRYPAGALAGASMRLCNYHYPQLRMLNCITCMSMYVYIHVHIHYLRLCTCDAWDDMFMCNFHSFSGHTLLIYIHTLSWGKGLGSHSLQTRLGMEWLMTSWDHGFHGALVFPHPSCSSGLLRGSFLYLAPSEIFCSCARTWWVPW